MHEHDSGDAFLCFCLAEAYRFFHRHRHAVSPAALEYMVEDASGNRPELAADMCIAISNHIDGWVAKMTHPANSGPLEGPVYAF